MLSEQIVDQLVRIIVAVASSLKIILFGSYAYGTPGSQSDLDIAVMKDLVESKARESALRRH